MRPEQQLAVMAYKNIYFKNEYEPPPEQVARLVPVNRRVLKVIKTMTGGIRSASLNVIGERQHLGGPMRKSIGKDIVLKVEARNQEEYDEERNRLEYDLVGHIVFMRAMEVCQERNCNAVKFRLYLTGCFEGEGTAVLQTRQTELTVKAEEVEEWMVQRRDLDHPEDEIDDEEIQDPEPIMSQEEPGDVIARASDVAGAAAAPVLGRAHPVPVPQTIRVPSEGEDEEDDEDAEHDDMDEPMHPSRTIAMTPMELAKFQSTSIEAVKKAYEQPLAQYVSGHNKIERIFMAMLDRQAKMHEVSMANVRDEHDKVRTMLLKHLDSEYKRREIQDARIDAFMSRMDQSHDNMHRMAQSGWLAMQDGMEMQHRLMREREQLLQQNYDNLISVRSGGDYDQGSDGSTTAGVLMSLGVPALAFGSVLLEKKNPKAAAMLGMMSKSLAESMDGGDEDEDEDDDEPEVDDGSDDGSSPAPESKPEPKPEPEAGPLVKKIREVRESITTPEAELAAKVPAPLWKAIAKVLNAKDDETAKRHLARVKRVGSAHMVAMADLAEEMPESDVAALVSLIS